MRISDWSSDVCSSDLGRVGAVGAAGERQGLAAAAAPVDLAPVAAAAGLRHPVGTAEPPERLGGLPDLARAPFADALEAEPGNGGGGMARQHGTVGDRKSTRLNSVTNAHLVCRLL